MSSGHRAVLLPLPSALLAPLPWPRLHLAKARLILTGDGESALVQSMLSKENKEQSTRISLAWSAKEKVNKLRRRLGLATGTTKLLKKTELKDSEGLDCMLVARERSLPSSETGHSHLISALQHLALAVRSKEKEADRILKKLLDLVGAASWKFVQLDDFLETICEIFQEDKGRVLLVHLGTLIRGVLVKVMPTCNEKKLQSKKGVVRVLFAGKSSQPAAVTKLLMN